MDIESPDSHRLPLPSDNRSERRQTEADLARLAALVEDSDDAIISKTLDGTILSWNPAAERLFGYSAAEAIGEPVWIIVPDERLEEERGLLAQLSKGEQVGHLETYRCRRDRVPLRVSVSISPIRGAQGKVIAASTIIRDMSERYRTEAALRESAGRLQGILDSAVDAIITIDQRGNIDSLNPATELLFGYTRQELVGKNVKVLMPEPYCGEHDGYLQNYLNTGEAKIIGLGREVTGLKKDGSTFPLYLSVGEVKTLGGSRLFTGIIHDLTERRRLEREILDASHREQRRIGQDLHDGLCQYLTGIGLSVEVLARKLSALAPAEAEGARRIGELVREAAVQARNLAHGLNPVVMDVGGLAVALQQYARQVTELFRISCVVRCDDDVNVTDGTTAMHLYRIAQEAVGNAIRHGGASRVEIKVRQIEKELLLSVHDNGSGISRHSKTGSGMGLQTMNYRARLIGGILTVTPGKLGGTVVTCRLRCP